jgi:hypothetical protein
MVIIGTERPQYIVAFPGKRKGKISKIFRQKNHFEPSCGLCQNWGCVVDKLGDENRVLVTRIPFFCKSEKSNDSLRHAATHRVISPKN